LSSQRTEVIYGLHAVRALLTRHPERVARVFLQHGRHDARADEIERLARAAGREVARVDARQLQARLGEAVHQGIVAEVAPLATWSEEQLLEAVAAVIVPRDRAAPLNATARKVAAGAAESTPVATVTNLARTLGLLKGAGLWIVGADSEATQPAHEIDLTGPRVLVMGAEGGGLRQLTRRHCDWLARLPNLGTVQSLNVSVATGMLLYEALRQRGAPG
jgi:23S rRNA (guanosine2251-2'-O)-methyltransferase